MADANVGMSGELEISHVPGRAAHVVESPFNKTRIIIVDAEHEAGSIAQFWKTHLLGHHFRPHPKGKYIAGKHFGDENHPLVGEKHELVGGKPLDLGSGLITNAFVNLLANEDNNMTAATPFASFSSMLYHRIGTGTTAAAASDYYLQTAIAAGSLTGSTNGYMTATASVTTPNTRKTVATFTLNATLAVTEWIVANANAANIASTATGANTATRLIDSGAPFSNTGNKNAGWTIEINSTAINTSPTTTTMGLISVSASNNTTTVDVLNGWWHLDNSGPATTPGNVAYVAYPTAMDHKVFSAINGVANDTIQFTHSVAMTAGG